jgi:hypothetical protein
MPVSSINAVPGSRLRMGCFVNSVFKKCSPYF